MMMMVRILVILMKKASLRMMLILGMTSGLWTRINLGGSNSKMETDPSIPSGNSGPRAAHMSLETSVQAKVYGKEAHIPNESVLVVRRAEDNIGKNPIQQFDDESDDDVEDINVGKEVMVSSKP
jgi:hypothetical protein